MDMFVYCAGDVLLGVLLLSLSLCVYQQEISPNNEQTFLTFAV